MKGLGGAHNIYCTVTVLATFRMVCLPEERPLKGSQTPDWEVGPRVGSASRCVGSGLICHVDWDLIDQQHLGGLFEAPHYSFSMGSLRAGGQPGYVVLRMPGKVSPCT